MSTFARSPITQRAAFKRPPGESNGAKFRRWFCLAALAAVAFFLITLPNARDISTAAPGDSIQIFDHNDQLVVTIDGDEEREFAALKTLPKTIPQALMSAEDHDFYKHHGVSLKGISRALVSNISHGHVVEGGSTLTQQLAKNLFFDSTDRSIVRKVREAFMAMQIELLYNKYQIMELYLNQVYFGRGAYGIERAARKYFGKNATELNLPESAFLMGLVKAPSSLGEQRNVQDAIDRQHLVLDKMAELNYITQKQADAAKNQKLVFNGSNSRITKYPYYMSAVRAFLNANLDKKTLQRGGLRVYTNLDPVAQKLAEQTLAKRVNSAGGGMNQAALVSVSVKDGAVLALVGGSGNYWQHQWNAAIGQHTLGSSFKPFVYLTGFLRNVINPESIVWDAPITIPSRGMPSWTPKNFDGQYYGAIPIRKAIALSRNVCAVRVGMSVGVGNVLQTARAAGLKDAQLNPTPALCLGASSASPLEMAGAYATFARDGVYMPPSLVRHVTSRNGFRREFKSDQQRVFPDFPVRQLVSCMESVVKEGTAVMAKLPDRPVAGKTGTTDEAKDLWFVGFTPDLVTAVWGGNDKHQSLGSATGGAMLTTIWKAYNEAYYKAHPTPPGSFLTGESTQNPQAMFANFFRNPMQTIAPEDEQQQQEQTTTDEQTQTSTDAQQEQNLLGPTDGSDMPPVAPAIEPAVGVQDAQGATRYVQPTDSPPNFDGSTPSQTADRTTAPEHGAPIEHTAAPEANGVTNIRTLPRQEQEQAPPQAPPVQDEPRIRDYAPTSQPQAMPAPEPAPSN